MKLITPSSQPATKEDLCLLQKTVVASSIASTLVLVQALQKTVYASGKSMEFADDMYKMITMLMDNFELIDPD